MPKGSGYSGVIIYCLNGEGASPDEEAWLGLTYTNYPGLVYLVDELNLADAKDEVHWGYNRLLVTATKGLARTDKLVEVQRAAQLLCRVFKIENITYLPPDALPYDHEMEALLGVLDSGVRLAEDAFASGRVVGYEEAVADVSTALNTDARLGAFGFPFEEALELNRRVRSGRV